MSDMPTPPSGLRVEHDVRNEYANGIERLQTRLLHIGLFLLTVVTLGGGAGVLMVVTGESGTAAIAVVVGCAVAVLVALLAAMSATRQLTPLIRRPPPVVAARPVPPPPQQETPRTTRHAEASPLWPRPSEQQVTITDDPGQRREVFVKLARRLQSLINRAIKRIDELEQENEDPELLDGLYEIDHLFTLARRQGENLAVLGGEAPQRRSNKPVSVYAVLLASVSEAEHYRQIAIVPVEDVEIHGHAVAEIIHLLAELLENATRFTSPDGPKVEVRAHKVTAGLAIEVQDRGLGMSYEDLDRINSLLDGSTRIDLSELLEDGRIGLAVVRELARRHDIRVRLQSNIFGGIAAAVVIPPQLLSESEHEPRQRVSAQQHSALPKRQPESAGVLEEPAAARSATPDRPVPSPTPRSPEPATPSERSGPIPLPGRRASRAEQSGPITPVSEQGGGRRSVSPSERSGSLSGAGRTASPLEQVGRPTSRSEQSGSFPIPGRAASESDQVSRPTSRSEQSGSFPVPGRAAPQSEQVGQPASHAEQSGSFSGAGRAASQSEQVGRPTSHAEQSGPVSIPGRAASQTEQVGRPASYAEQSSSFSGSGRAASQAEQVSRPATHAEQSSSFPVPGRTASESDQVSRPTSHSEQSGSLSIPGRAASPTEQVGRSVSHAEQSGSFSGSGRAASQAEQVGRPASRVEQSGAVSGSGRRALSADESGEAAQFSEQGEPVQVPSPPAIPGRVVPSPGPRGVESGGLGSGAGREAVEQGGPIQVPAPTPIPPASVPSRAATSGVGRRRRAESGDSGGTELPALPVRAPGRAYEDLRSSGKRGVTEEIVADEGEQPPPLPQRRGSHLREELLDPPAVTTPVPGHNTNLMKTVQAGRENWFAEQNRESTRGDSWPTT